MKIALFGGAFDPPHLGHKLVADSLIRNKIVDEVWFVPVYKHPWADRYGKKKLTDYNKRVEMLGLTISSNNSEEENEFSKKQIVAHYKDVSFTFDTLEYFSQQFPENNFSWVMGSEYLDRFDDFLKGHPQLIDYPFYIYPRAGYPLNEDFKKDNMTFLSDMPEVKVSSTEIKELVRIGKSISELIAPKVLNFIEIHNLYKD